MCNKSISCAPGDIALNKTHGGIPATMDAPAYLPDKKDKILKIVKYSCKFIPALLLAILMTVALVTTDFQLSGNAGDNTGTKTDSLYLILMIIMLGISVIIPIIGRGKINTVIGGVCYASFPFACFFLLEYYNRNPFKDSPVMKDELVMLNVLFFYILCLTLTFLTTRSDVAIAVTAGIPMIFGFANYLATAFRDAPIFPWDILSFGTAMSVLDNYTIKMTSKLWFILFSFTFMIGIGFLVGFRFKMKKKLIWINIVAAVISLSTLAGFVFYARSDEAEKKYGYYPYLFSSKYLYKYNGTALSFIWTTKYLKMDKPSGYSVSELKELYEKYEQLKEEEEVKPNIIVIMNEAFSDLSVLGEFTTNKEYLPFIQSLTDNTVKGNVYVSVKGGNTPNSEFEFLTGTSMAYLPAGSIPYQQYINSDTPSMVSQLEELGYSTTAMHPYPASGWERNEVYERLGFDSAYFLPDFSGAQRIRSYVSDLGMYKKLISLYEETRESGDASPQFFFGVTMQNHGSYKKVSSFTPDIEITELPKDSSSTYYEIATYLSLIKKSDEAFEYLVDYFSNVDEPTIILMFGDHQPNDYIAKPILKMNGISDISSVDLKTQQIRWQTPYIVWSNYEISENNRMDSGDTSLNYLGAMLLRHAGIPLTSFQRWLTEELQPQYPIINANSYVDAGGVFHSISDINSVPVLNTYAQLQYNLVFDTRNRIKNLFSILR